ncbi:site-specific integrase, partial [Mycobacterium alsense]
HLQRPDHPDRQLTNAKVGSTVNQTAPMAETGIRVGELLALRVEDVSPGDCSLVIRRAKGGKSRRVRFSAACAAALERYIRSRRMAGWEDGPLWIGKRAPLDYKGLTQSLKGRAGEAGVKNFHPHRLRHTAAVRWLRSGGSETGLMAQAGWKSREMIGRYVSTAAEELAASEFDRLNLGFG